MTLIVDRARDLDILVAFTEDEVDFMLAAVTTAAPDFVCEWGTNVGYSARVLYEIRDLLGLGFPLHSVEITEQAHALRPADVGKGRGFHVEGLDVRLHVGDGPTVFLDLYRASGCERPLVFVDDNHVEQSLYDDLIFIATEVPEAAMLIDDAVVGSGREPDRALRRFLDAGIVEYRQTVGPTMTLLIPVGA